MLFVPFVAIAFVLQDRMSGTIARKSTKGTNVKLPWGRLQGRIQSRVALQLDRIRNRPSLCTVAVAVGVTATASPGPMS